MASGIPKNLGDSSWKGSRTPKGLGSRAWRGSSMPKTLGDQSWKGSTLPKSMGVNRGNSEIIHPSPDTTGRNNSIGLPKVSGGMPPHPTHINNLSAAVDKNTIRSMTGGLVKQNNGGTTITFPNKPTNHPFQVSLSGERVMMNVGNVFSYGNLFCPIAQYFPSTTSTATIPRGGEFNLPANSTSAFDNTKVVTSSADVAASKFSFPLDNASNPRVIWMDMLTSPPTLKNTPQENFTAASGIPIAYIKGSVVIQLVKTDIFARPPLGLQASVSKDANNQYYLSVTAGHINNVVPTLGGNAISNPATKLAITTVSKEVWLKCNRSAPPAHFPVTVEIELGDLNVFKSDTDSAGYIRLGTYTFTNGVIGSVFNYLGGSLWGEAHKFNPSTASYYFYRI